MDRRQEVASELIGLAQEAQEQFGGLTEVQLNWKPSPESWSVGQCLDHLITTHSLYLSTLQAFENGSYRPSVWQRISPLSGFFGLFLIKALQPDNRKKLKAPAKVQPSGRDVGADIVERFSRHQEELASHFRNLPGDIDPARTIMASPLLRLVTYSLDDAMTVLVVHCQRHLGQARRATESDGFPA